MNEGSRLERCHLVIPVDGTGREPRKDIFNGQMHYWHTTRGSEMAVRQSELPVVAKYIQFLKKN